MHRVGELKAGDNIVLVIAASRAPPGRLRGRRISHGLSEDAGAVLEERDDGAGDSAWVEARDADEDAAEALALI